MKKLIALIPILYLIVSCTVSTKKDSVVVEKPIAEKEMEKLIPVEKPVISKKEEESPKKETIINQRFFIRGENVFVNSKPHGQGEKILNVKATNYYGKKTYYKLSNLDEVYILQEDKDWVEIKHVRFSANRGWVAKKDVQITPDKKEIFVALEEKDYDLIKTTSSGKQNFYILSKMELTDKFQVKLFIKRLRKINKFKAGNIYLFDNLRAVELFDKSSVTGKDYIFLAEHFLAMSTFDAPNSAWWLPYIDDKYISAGGKKSRN